MISPAYMAESFGRNVTIIKRQTAGLTQAESLLQLPFRSNCMNWIVGHVVTNRNTIFRLLNADPVLDAERAEFYKRESEPITGDGPGVLTLDELIAALETAQTRLEVLVASLAPEDYEREVAVFGRTSQSVGHWLLFLYFHESYHVGQTEILRQATGKDDKII